MEASSLHELLEQVKSCDVLMKSMFFFFELVSERFSGPDFDKLCTWIVVRSSDWFPSCRVSGGQGVHVVLPRPDSGPGGGRHCGGLRGVLPVSAHQHTADGAGERRHVDAEQGERDNRDCREDPCSSWYFGYFNVWNFLS